MTIEQIEIEARQIAARGGETKEQAFSRLLALEPEAYAAHRAQHNAAPLVATLKAAGIKVSKP